MWEKGHALTKGEQGCFVSYRTLWEACLNMGDPLFIMEYNIYFYDFYKNITGLARLIQRFEYIRLGRCTCHSLLGVGRWMHMHNTGNSHCLVKHMKGPSCTHAHIISPAAVLSFLFESAKWFWPVDDFMDKEYFH